MLLSPVEVPQVTIMLLEDLSSANASILASGCVVAGRLAYADPNLQVMLIEGSCSRNPISNIALIMTINNRWE